jgi:hypothetical protein
LSRRVGGRRWSEDEKVRIVLESLAGPRRQPLCSCVASTLSYAGIYVTARSGGALQKAGDPPLEYARMYIEYLSHRYSHRYFR